jgi:TonB-dependent receptor
VNGPGADIKGVEVAFQRDLTFLPAPFDRLGIVANATYADGASAVLYNTTAVVLPLTYLSKYTTNATLYYETSTWGVRISQAYRSSYLDGAGSFGNIGDFTAATNNVDLDAHLSLTAHLKLRFEAINLTDQPIIQYTDRTARRLEVNTRAGRTFVMGCTYEF